MENCRSNSNRTLKFEDKKYIRSKLELKTTNEYVASNGLGNFENFGELLEKNYCL